MQRATGLLDGLHLLLEHGTCCVPGENQERAHGTLAGVQVFVEAAGWSMLVESARARKDTHTQIVGFQNQKNNAWHFAQQLDELLEHALA